MSSFLPILFFVTAISLFLFWVKMILKASASKIDSSNKTFWILGMLFGGPVFSFVYYFATKPNKRTGNVKYYKTGEIIVLLLATWLAMLIAIIGFWMIIL